MNRKIIFKDGVFFDERWNAITPTFEELTEITTAIYKYTQIRIQEVTV